MIKDDVKRHGKLRLGVEVGMEEVDIAPRGCAVLPYVEL